MRALALADRPCGLVDERAPPVNLAALSDEDLRAAEYRASSAWFAAMGRHDPAAVERADAEQSRILAEQSRRGMRVAFEGAAA